MFFQFEFTYSFSHGRCGGEWCGGRVKRPAQPLSTLSIQVLHAAAQRAKLQLRTFHAAEEVQGTVHEWHDEYFYFKEFIKDNSDFIPPLTSLWMESQEKSRLLFTRMGRAGAGIGLDDREDFRGLGQYLKNYQEYMNNQQRFTSGLQQL